MWILLVIVPATDALIIVSQAFNLIAEFSADGMMTFGLISLASMAILLLASLFVSFIRRKDWSSWLIGSGLPIIFAVGYLFIIRDSLQAWSNDRIDFHRIEWSNCGPSRLEQCSADLGGLNGRRQRMGSTEEIKKQDQEFAAKHTPDLLRKNLNFFEVFRVFIPILGNESKDVKMADKFFNRISDTAQNELYLEPGAVVEYDDDCGFKVGRRSSSDSYDYYSIFGGDINQDGKSDWILVGRCGGSAGTDTLVDVFEDTDGILKPMGFDSMYRSAFGRDPTDIPLKMCDSFIKDNCFCFANDKEKLHLCIDGKRGNLLTKAWAAKDVSAGQ